MIASVCPTNRGIKRTESAAEAIDLLRGSFFDVCFLDYFLTDGGTGFDVLNGLKDKNLLTAFVFLTMNTKRQTAFEALQLGAMDYLIKAKFDEFELAKCISYALYRKYKEVELQTSALKDSLTGLGNRVLFEENLQMAALQAKRSDENLGVLYIDIDDFKEINDTHGHVAGDEVLKSISERIVDQTRESDVVARLGGDEFAAVLVRVDKPERVQQIAQNIEQAISSKPYEIDRKMVSVAASVGASVFPNDTSDINELVKTADMRMYGSKKSKKDKKKTDSNVHFYNPVSGDVM
ncbi:MAG: GGDEF domain-containing response regulator [Rhodospirillales bacterium]|nr:GGDEF domain-containing response regulator [Rhodospirillales bacterium]